MVSAQKGAAGVPHCVVPPVQEKMHTPMLQMVMAEGSVGHMLPHLPLRNKHMQGSVTSALAADTCESSLQLCHSAPAAAACKHV